MNTRATNSNPQSDRGVSTTDHAYASYLLDIADKPTTSRDKHTKRQRETALVRRALNNIEREQPSPEMNTKLGVSRLARGEAEGLSASKPLSPYATDDRTTTTTEDMVKGMVLMATNDMRKKMSRMENALDKLARENMEMKQKLEVMQRDNTQLRERCNEPEGQVKICMDQRSTGVIQVPNNNVAALTTPPPAKEKRLAILSNGPRTLIEVWNEYKLGGVGKPAEQFTVKERNIKENKHVYINRKIIWDAIERMVKGGKSVAGAIHEIKCVYGHTSVTKIMREMRKDKRRYPGGIHPDLR